jgi:hypothetical protein
MPLKKNNISKKQNLAGPRIMWIPGPKDEEDHDRLLSQAKDIADHGFKGVVITPRSAKYDLRHKKSIELLKDAAYSAKLNNLDVWIMADPRLASESIIQESRETLELIIINQDSENYWNGSNLNTVKIFKGDFVWFMSYPAIRHTHILMSGGIAYLPIEVDSVFAFKRNETGQVVESHNVTDHCLMTSDEFSRELSVSAEDLDKYNDYEVVAFPRFRTNFFDYTSSKSWELWDAYIKELLSKIDCISGICWDEPGFYADSGQFPAGERFYTAFRNKYGYDLKNYLLWLVLESQDKRHIQVRHDYYSFLNDIIAQSVRNQGDLSRKYAVTQLQIVDDIVTGIHATWHGEFCGLEEMNHGSMDLWKIRRYQSASFTDIGGAERLIHPETAPDVIYSLTLAKSLSRIGKNPEIIYCNLWGNTFGTYQSEAPPEILDYWKDLLDLFNANWLAHAYGYTGTSKKDLGFGPGYPDHPTWNRFTHLNCENNISSEFRPASDVLIIFPIQSFYALGHKGGNCIGWEMVKLVDKMFRMGYVVDIFTPFFLTKGAISDGKMVFRDVEYTSVILPYCRVMPEDSLKALEQASEAGVEVIADIQDNHIYSLEGKKMEVSDKSARFNLMDNPFREISSIIKPAIALPDGAIANIFIKEKQIQLRIMPDFPGREFSGKLIYGSNEVDIPHGTIKKVQYCISLKLDEM